MKFNRTSQFKTQKEAKSFAAKVKGKTKIVTVPSTSPFAVLWNEPKGSAK